MQGRNKKTKVHGSREKGPTWSRGASKVFHRGRCQSPVLKKELELPREMGEREERWGGPRG